MTSDKFRKCQQTLEAKHEYKTAYNTYRAPLSREKVIEASGVRLELMNIAIV